MTSLSTFAEIAALAGDPGRAAMLRALMDGRALTASELAYVAGVTAQTASGHLARMTTAGLLSVAKQGRHRYHRLASSDVAQMIESIMQVASGPGSKRSPLAVGPKDAALRLARTCYDHLAGRLGVALADAVVGSGHVELATDGGLVTDAGVDFFGSIGIDFSALMTRDGKRSSRILCRPCLDWSERRPHIAGSIGAALCAHSFAAGWIDRINGTRAVMITPKGQRVFLEQFGVQLG
ncbi:MAG: helix-turn-helix transcriptional regulator [Alphaproteobacteria bacterium]|nr:helix-turn-helix transcriptional regulator [Alphaproteobacteria bacterium]